jgi:hypothetical protein
MWTSELGRDDGFSVSRSRSAPSILILVCSLLIGLQVPYSQNAWYHRQFLIAYFEGMALKLGQLASHPERVADCVPELAVCQNSLAKRRELMALLYTNQLNVFSPRVQRWHSFLPHIQVEKSAQQDYGSQ